MPVIASAFFLLLTFLKANTMNHKNLIKIAFLIVSVALTGFRGESQVLISKISPESASPSGEGFYYTLPKTLLKIQLTVQKIEQQPGPLAAFAADYLGVTNEIKEQKTDFRLLEVTLHPVSIPDENQLFYVQLPTEKAKDEKNLIFELSPNGQLVSVNESEQKHQLPPPQSFEQNIFYQEGANQFDYFPAYNRKKKVDTVIRKITIDTMTINRFMFKTSWVDKSERERAEEAAQQISHIREARFNLLSGYHEVNFGEGIRYMDAQLMEMERKYTELFLGKETVTHMTETVLYDPVKGDKRNQTIAVIGGEGVVLDITQDEVLKAMPTVGTSGVNVVFYRIPAEAKVKISFRGINYYYDELTVNQLGVVASASVLKTRLQFNPQTGSIMGIQKE
jgi:hypothetical protein